MLQKLKKILRAHHEIQTCIVLDHNWAKIAHLAQKTIFWEISSKWFLSTYCALSWCKVWKKFLEQILRYRLTLFWTTIGSKLPIWPKRQYFGKFQVNDFYLLTVHCHGTKFEKNSWSRSWDVSLHNFGLQSGQNYPFGINQDFLGNFTWVIFIYLLSHIMLQSLKKILEESEKFYKVEKDKDIQKHTQIYQGQ